MLKADRETFCKWVTTNLSCFNTAKEEKSIGDQLVGISSRIHYNL